MASVEQVAALIAHVGGRATVDDAFAGAKWDEASALVRAYMGNEGNRVPAAIRTSATLEVAAKLWARRGAPNGSANFVTIDGAPVRAPLDPMVTAYPILGPFLSGGFA